MNVSAPVPGIRKAAILLTALGEEPSSQIFKHLNEEEIERLAKEIAQLGSVPPDAGERVLTEFHQMASAASYVNRGGVEYARKLLEGPLPWSRMRHVYRLLGLARQYGELTTDEACARALEVGVVNVQRIDRMLQKGLETRRLLKSSAPRKAETKGKVLRFARDPSAFRISTGGSDVPA